MINSYIKTIDYYKEKDNERKYLFFGLGFGSFLVFFSIYKYISNLENLMLDYIYGIGLLIGIGLIVLTIINENLVKIQYKIINFFLKLIGLIIFKLLLALIYFLLVCPIGFIIQKNKKIFINSTFEDKKTNDFVNKNLKKKTNLIYQIMNIFKFFINQKTIYFIPVLIVLISIGILLIFVQSNIVMPFIYTIF